MGEPGPENRRRYARTKVGLLVQYRFDTFDDFVAEYSVDLSPGGMFIRTEEPAELGSVVYLQFSLRDGSRLVEALGKVVRVLPPSESQVGGMGVEFTQFDPESIALIEQICRQRDG